ncbi:uncharacterized protein LOC144928968 [Branchiostoma floridae x Branchiostoma belcheri]
MARVAVPLIVLVVVAVVVEGAPAPDRQLQDQAAVSTLLQQLFQASQQISENDQSPRVNLHSQGQGHGAGALQLTDQTELTGSEDGKTAFDCECHNVSAWRDPWCAYVCQQAIIG